MSAPTIVLLIDEQPLIGEGVRRMLAGQPDIVCHYCSTPRTAFEAACAVNPTVILQDVVMRDADGLALVRQFKEDPATADVPLVVLSAREDPQLKAAAFAAGANDYVVKLPDRVELLARVRHHSAGYVHLLERNAAHAALARELDDAASYVRSVLPGPADGPIATRWIFVSSAALGGDALGYHWLDDHRFAMYLLDVCGHGVGAALHSARVMQAVQRQGLEPGTDFGRPTGVLQALNRAFPMDDHRNMYLSVWYGVFDTRDRRLTYASAGHPPAVLVPPSGRQDVRLLRTPNVCAGILPDARFEGADTIVPPGAMLYIFSDGAYELTTTDEEAGGLQDFVDVLAAPLEDAAADLDRIKAYAEACAGPDGFDDDFSILRVALA